MIILTPEEIQEYKTQWLKDKAYSVKLKSSKDVEGKKWCRQHLERQEWSMNAFTQDKEHTFLFESEQIAREFEQQVK